MDAPYFNTAWRGWGCNYRFFMLVMAIKISNRFFEYNNSGAYEKIIV